jgi:GNAT superfamily N-acetyltransferase
VTVSAKPAAPPPVIRPAGPQDAPGVAALLAELGYPGGSAEQVRDRLARWAGAKNAVVLVADVAGRAGRLAGAVAVTAIPYFEHDGSWGRIVALVVAGESRGLGIGRLLVRAAEQVALDLGCLVMEVTSARNRAEAPAFYRAVGYQDRCPASARYLKDLVPGASAGSYAMRAASGNEIS